jgi:hypothetical protein
MLKRIAKSDAGDAEPKPGGSAEALAPQEQQGGNQIAGDKITGHAGYSA